MNDSQFKQDITSINKADNGFVDSIKLIFKDEYEKLTYLLDPLFWLDDMLVFLNYRYGFSQTAISAIFAQNGLSITQFGISKRLNTIDDKIKFMITVPVITQEMRDILIELVGVKNAEMIVLFLQEKSFNYIRILTGKIILYSFNKTKDSLKELYETKNPIEFVKKVKTLNPQSEISKYIEDLGFERIRYVISFILDLIELTNEKHFYSSHSSKMFDYYKQQNG